MTAGHCAFFAAHPGFNVLLSVIVGTNNLHDAKDENRYCVSKVTIHNEYHEIRKIHYLPDLVLKTLETSGDLAILKLNRAIVFTDKVRSIAISDSYMLNSPMPLAGFVQNNKFDRIE